MPGTLRATLSDWRRLAVIGLATAAAALGGALISQYGFDFAPCELCVLQRWPYVAGLITGAVAIALRARPRLSATALALTTLAFLTSIGFAVWHSGVEWGFIAPPDCGGETDFSNQSADALMSWDFERACDLRTEFFLGLSMANWNVLVSLLLTALFAGATLLRLGVFAQRAAAYSSSSASQ